MGKEYQQESNILVPVIRLSLGLGGILGSIEAIYLLFRLPWHFSAMDALVLGGASIVSGMLLSLFTGFIAGILAMAFTHRDGVVSDRWAVGMSVAAFLQLSAMTAGWIALLYQDKLWSSFGIIVASLFMFIFIIWQNARFWLRRSLLRSMKLGWFGFSFSASILLLGLGVILSQNRGYGGANVIETDPDVFLISMDGIGANAISKWSADSLAQTPNLDAKMGQCIQYTDAISVFPESLAGHVAMLTGHYPGQLNIISADDVLRYQINTITEKFAREGYATASFVSHDNLNARNGFSQGFQLFDDDRGAWFLGASRIRILGIFQNVLQKNKLRSVEKTLGRAKQFLLSYRSKPVFAFVQLQLSDGLSKQEYAAQVSTLDREIGDFLREIDGRQVDRKRLLILTSAFGMSWKRTGSSGEHTGLSEDVLRVPLIICPLKEGAKKRSSSQVRTIDIVNTVYNQVGFSHVKELPSADIVSNLSREPIPIYQTFLMARDPYSFTSGYTLGYRLQAKNSEYIYKYLWHSSRRKHGLYNLTLDPNESENRIEIAEEMTKILAEALMKNSSSIKGLEIGESEKNLSVLLAE